MKRAIPNAEHPAPLRTDHPNLRDIMQAAMAGIYPSQQALEAMLDRIERMP